MIGLVAYLACGVLIAFLGRTWSRLNIEPYDDRPLFLSRLTIVASWPIFLITVLANWIDGRPRS